MERDAKELTVVPCGRPSGVNVVITVTGEQTAPMTSLNSMS
nr:hypothetical protein JVH1_6704 [Rhodococcus sp. JVH1]